MQIAQHNFGTMEIVPPDCNMGRRTRQYVSFKIVSEFVDRKRREFCPIRNPTRYKFPLMKMRVSEVIPLGCGDGQVILVALTF